MLTRLNKHLADLGIASRRKADELIAAGKVKINGEVVTTLGTKVDSVLDKIEVDQAVLEARKELIYLALHKLPGYVTSNQATKLEPKIVLDLLTPENFFGADKFADREIAARVFPIGRLDKDTSGLLLLTNDGVLAYHLTHPKFECEKEYEFTISQFTPLTRERVTKLESGLKLWGEKTKPTKVNVVDAHRGRITLTEGKNRQIRRICQKVGCPVRTLARIRIKQLELKDLPPGKWRYLTPEEAEALSGIKNKE